MKIYTKYGYIIREKKYIIQFNNPLIDGYDWYISASKGEFGQAIGIKRKDNKKTITEVTSLNYIRLKKGLY